MAPTETIGRKSSLHKLHNIELDINYIFTSLCIFSYDSLLANERYQN